MNITLFYNTAVEAYNSFYIDIGSDIEFIEYMFVEDEYHVTLAYKLREVTFDIADLTIQDYSYAPPSTPSPTAIVEQKRTRLSRAKANREIKATTTPKTTPPRHLRPTPSRHLQSRQHLPASTTPQTTPPRAHRSIASVPRSVAVGPINPVSLHEVAPIAISKILRTVSSRNSHRTRLERAVRSITTCETRKLIKSNRAWARTKMHID